MNNNLSGPSPFDSKLVARQTLIKTIIVAFVVVIFIVLWQASEVFLVLFAGILVAVLLHNINCWISRKTRLPEKWSLAVVLLGALGLTAAIAWWVAPDIADQADRLTERIPKAWERVESKLERYGWYERLVDEKDQLEKIAPDGSKALSSVGYAFSSTFSALSSLVITIVIGLFLAASPRTYLNGAVKLAPLARRTRTREILEEIGDTLGSWLLAKLISMVVIGILTVVGLWFIGIDLALLLGLIAGLLSFIPNIGPILALIPAVLIALVNGPENVLYVVLLYTGVQAFESYLLTPLLQKRMVDLPPALTIAMQFLFGVLAGGLGLLLATPLTAMLMVLMKTIYIEDLLGDKTIADDGNDH